MEIIYKNLHSNQKILIYEMLKRGISVEVLDESLELITDIFKIIKNIVLIFKN